MTENVKNLLDMFSKHGFQVHVDMVKEILHALSYVQFLTSVHFSLSKSRFFVVRYTMCLINYMEAGSYICDRVELCDEF